MNQECAARNKHVKIGRGSTGFCKTFRNCCDVWVCIWWKKVYTLLILVCTGQYLVYSWFAPFEQHASECGNIIHASAWTQLACDLWCFEILHASKLLRQHHYGHRRFAQSLTKVYTDQENKVYTKFTQHTFVKFAHSLHTVCTPYPSLQTTSKLRVNLDCYLAAVYQNLKWPYLGSQCSV